MGRRKGDRARLFVAIDLPDEVREDLGEFLDPRREAAPFPFIASEQWHLTLAFMAAVDEVAQDALEDGLESVARRHAPFIAQLGGAGSFPDPTRARVLWLAVARGDDQVRRLGAAVRTTAVHAGAEVDGRELIPHLSLARLRRPIEATRWLRVLDTWTSAAFEVGSFVLIQSHLGAGARGRPRYDEVARYLLQRPSAG